MEVEFTIYEQGKPQIKKGKILHWGTATELQPDINGVRIAMPYTVVYVHNYETDQVIELIPSQIKILKP